MSVHGLEARVESLERRVDELSCPLNECNEHDYRALWLDAREKYQKAEAELERLRPVIAQWDKLIEGLKSTDISGE